MNAPLILRLVGLRYKLLWAQTRTRNGRIALFLTGYLFAVFILILAAAGGLGVGVLRRTVGREALAIAGDHLLDRIGEMHLGDVVVASLNADLVRLEKSQRFGQTSARHSNVLGELLAASNHTRFIVRRQPHCLSLVKLWVLKCCQPE